MAAPVFVFLFIWCFALSRVSAFIRGPSLTQLTTTPTTYGTDSRNCRMPRLPPTSCFSTNPLPTELRLSSIADGDIRDFFVASADADTETDTAAGKGFGLYIHIPYCRQRCRYCDFAIVPIGDHGATTTITEKPETNNGMSVENCDGDDSIEGKRERGFRRMNDRYVSAIIAELKQIASRNNNNKLPLRSIYFGGGTPSLAPVESIQTILYHACGADNPEAPFDLLQQKQPKKDDETKTGAITTPEITMEMDPGTFDRDQLSALHGLGINRISLGVQSFDDDLLHAMGRTHRRVDILQAIRDIASVFGRNKGDNTNSNNCDYSNVNYSIDLISGCPGLTPAKWVETLQEATAGVETKKTIPTGTIADPGVSSATTTTTTRTKKLLSSLPPPKHISIYDMQIEEGTVFGKWAAKAEAEAAANRNEQTGPSMASNGDEDEDPSRQFTVAVPVDDGDDTSGTPWKESRQPKNQNQQQNQQHQRLLRLPTEEECAFMYKYAAGYLRAKHFEHYEVSSYAAFTDQDYKTTRSEDDIGDHGTQNESQSNASASKRSLHNQIYWEYDGQWHAVGLGATSFVDRKLVARPREMSNYLNWVDEGADTVTSTPTPTTMNEDGNNEDDAIDDDILSDLLLKRLRTIDGMDLEWLEQNYGSEIVEDVLDGAKLGLELGLAEHTNGNVLRLSNPDGLLYSNFIISSIFAELGYT